MKDFTKLVIMAVFVAVTATLSWSGVPNTLPTNLTPSSTDWTAAKIAYAHWRENHTASPAEKELITQYLQSIHPRSNGNPLDNQGGPDGFGYRYVDNQSDTASFSWIELCGDNQATDGPEGDDGDALATIGWNFPFYGSPYGTVYVSTNGFMRFDDIFNTFTNACLLDTQTSEPGPLIAPYWDDMYAIDAGGCNNDGTAPWIRWRNFGGSYFVVEWSQVPHYVDGIDPSADRFSFEAILYPDGKIKFQYNNGWNDSVNPNSASIGIDDQTANYGLAYRCNDTGNNQISGGRAIWFYHLVTCADFSVTAPGLWSGNTCGSGNDCTQRSSVEQIYAVTIPWSGHWIFTTCDSGTDYDTFIFLMTDCCSGSVLAFDDDGCELGGTQSLNSTIVSDVLAPGTYYLVLEAFSSVGCGNYTLRVEPSCVSIQPGDVVESFEDVLEDTTFYYSDPDGGCNSNPPVYGSIGFNETICGLGFTYTYPGQYRDTDWYTFSHAIAESITVVLATEFPAVIYIVDYSDCGSPSIIAAGVSTQYCTEESFPLYVPSGTYALFVGPSVFDGLNILDSLNYRVHMYHGTNDANVSETSLPLEFSLLPNYPNPFNPETRLSFALPRASDVKLAVFDITGRLVSVLAQARYEAGVHEVRFDGSNLPSGIYFARLNAGDFTATHKMTLLK